MLLAEANKHSGKILQDLRNGLGNLLIGSTNEATLAQESRWVSQANMSCSLLLALDWAVVHFLFYVT